MVRKTFVIYMIIRKRLLNISMWSIVMITIISSLIKQLLLARSVFHCQVTRCLAMNMKL